MSGFKKLVGAVATVTLINGLCNVETDMLNDIFTSIDRNIEAIVSGTGNVQQIDYDVNRICNGYSSKLENMLGDVGIDVSFPEF